MLSMGLTGMPRMSYNAPQSTSIDTVRSYRRFNAKLAELSIPQLTEAGHSQFIASHDLARMGRAIEVAPNDAGAHAYVQRTLQPYIPIEPQPAANLPTPAQVNPRVSNLADHRRPGGSSPTQPSQQAPARAGDSPSQEESSPGSGNPNPASAPGNREYINEHVYGGKAALCFSADMTKGDVHTITMDAAPLVATRQYKWADKITIQMTAGEMPHVAAVLFGLLPECDYGNHGPQHNKGFKIVNQREDGKPGKVFVQVRGPGVSHAVPIFAADLWRVGNLFAMQLMREHKNLRSTADVIAMLRTTFVRMVG